MLFKRKPKQVAKAFEASAEVAAVLQGLPEDQQQILLAEFARLADMLSGDNPEAPEAPEAADAMPEGEPMPEAKADADADPGDRAGVSVL